MARAAVWVVAAVVAAAPGIAGAGTLQILGGATFSGVVTHVEDGNATFLWQKDKDQPPENVILKSDKLFQAQGHELIERVVPMSQIDNVDGIPARAYPGVFGYNLFYRAFQELAASWLIAGSTGDFVRQIKNVAMFLGFLLGIIPLLFVLVAMLFPGDRVGFFHSAALVVVLTALGLGASYVSGIVVAAAPDLGHPGIQAGISAVLVALFGVVLGTLSRFSLLQGLAFTVAWAAALVLGAKVFLSAAGITPGG
jgi:hypothetical protein